MIGWALTYILHSTLLVASAEALTRAPWVKRRGAQAADAIWKAALVGALLTATLQQLAGSPTSLALPTSAARSASVATSGWI